MEVNEIITDTVIRYGLPMAGQPIRGESGAPYIVHILIARDAHGRQEPPQKRLIEAKAIVEAQGIPLEFVLINQRIEHAEQNLRATMLANHSNLVRNIFLTSQGARTEVWIEEKGDVEIALRTEVEKTVLKFAQANKIKSISIHFMHDEIIPATFEVLSAIRRIAPTSCELLKQELELRSFSVPSLDWVNRKFDVLRKAGLVVRISDRKYAVTLEGLQRLGTRKGRSSPDVVRLLALARAGG